MYPRVGERERERERERLIGMYDVIFIKELILFVYHTQLYRLRHFLKKIILNKELQENNNYSTIDYIASNYCIAH